MVCSKTETTTEHRINNRIKQMKEIPEFLLEMSNQLNTQDNRITADPIWHVCYDKKEITEDGYQEFTEYAVSDGDYDIVYSNETDSLCDNEWAIEYLQDHYPEFCEKWEKENDAKFEDFDIESELRNLPKDIEEYHMTRRREIVKTCLTESDANWFINRKQHDYPKLYTYVFSMCYCPQMIELRKWIKSLTEVK